MALTEAQKADVRRHLGYGLFGDTGDGGSFISYRFMVHHGLLEYRMNHLTDVETIILIGTNNPMAPANPNFIDPSTDAIYEGYLNICNFLEGQVATSTDNLDIKRAGDYEARQDEVSARAQLYTMWCRKMARFLELPMRQSSGTIMVS